MELKAKVLPHTSISSTLIEVIKIQPSSESPMCGNGKQSRFCAVTEIVFIVEYGITSGAS
jgi:hypothetical protein